MKRMTWTGWLGPGLIWAAILGANPAHAEPELDLAGGKVIAGARFGLSHTPHVHHAEAFTDWRLPWSWELGRGFGLDSYLAGSLGWLGDDREGAVTGSLGPAFRLTYAGLPVSVVGGSSPTFIGRNRFGPLNLGSAFQFTSHLGVAWAVFPRLELGYRFQHMSNAGIDDDNPGLDSHVVMLAWRF